MLSTILDAGILLWLILILASVMLSNYFFIQQAKQLPNAYKILLLTVFLRLHVVANICGGIRTGGLL